MEIRASIPAAAKGMAHSTISRFQASRSRWTKKRPIARKARPAACLVLAALAAIVKKGPFFHNLSAVTAACAGC